MTSGVASILVPEPPLGSSVRCAGGSDRFVQRRFVAGSENRLAEVAVRSLLEGSHSRSHSGSHSGYNPLVLHGPHGVGKSHLARGLADLWQADENRGEALGASEPDTGELDNGALYTTSTDFAREFAAACDADQIELFRRRYRTVSLLVLEDLGGLASKQAAQVEFIHTLDTLLDAGGCVVVTSCLPIAETPRLRSALVSRLSAGLIVALSPPGKAARLEILRDLAAARDIPLAAPAAQLLAEEITGTALELTAALGELQVASQPDGQAVTVEQARRYLADRAARSRPPVGEIVALTARYFSVTQTVLRGKSRTQSVVMARGVAMYLARRLTTQSLHQIGRSIGRRDHTTVLHHCRKIDRLLQSDRAVRQAVDQLQHTLTSGSDRR